jgi:hypothetical protein
MGSTRFWRTFVTVFSGGATISARAFHRNCAADSIRNRNGKTVK